MIEVVILTPLQLLREMLELQQKGLEAGASIIPLQLEQRVL